MSYNEIGDSELIYLIRNNNKEAKDYLIKRYQTRIYGIINSIRKRSNLDTLSYEDYFHECFLVFMKCLDTFDEQYNFYSYVSKSIERQIYRLLEKDKINSEIISLDNDSFYQDYSSLEIVSDASYLYKEKEIEEYIKRKFDNLDQEIIKYKLLGYSSLQISKLLNVNKKVIYRRIEGIKEVLLNKNGFFASK